ncbi:hypothetical protein [Virgibacillus sp. MSJ-26]|uniref:hypothetical protein n=1 Tax=Virgibacillus sp. MSJ-26 TaxID=2841522 RepID=UPI00209DC6D8|nr:hypothetical protein [Virgibacillus sp. MSJ-26]
MKMPILRRKQMGDGWINGGNSGMRLESAEGIDKADDILLEGYERFVINVLSDGKVVRKKVNEVGNLDK